MLSKKIKHKNNLIIFILRLIFGLVFFDEKNIFLKKKIQRYFLIPHYLERLYELLLLYPLSIKSFLEIVKKFGYPTSVLYKENFNKVFTLTDSNNLFNSYRKQDAMYTTRLMLTYNRIDFIAPYFKQILDSPIKNVLDYGCGVSDIGLLLSKYGLNVSIVDLDLPKLDFTAKRFAWRNMKVTKYSVTNTEKLANIDSKFDLIIATEIIEHFRSPINMINFFYKHLNPNGFLLISIGKEFEKEEGGDHLVESLKEGNSSAYWKNFNSKFRALDERYHFFQKKK